MPHMEVITPTRAAGRTSFVPVIAGTIIGTVCIVAGVVLAWVALGTSFLSSVMPPPRADAVRTAAGMAVWALALVAPAALVLIGTSRLARILGRARGRVPRKSLVMKALGGLPADVSLASGIVLPDGRGTGEVIIGPFGAAIIRELPPADLIRIRNGHWEVRAGRGWLPLENPLERTTRDAERVRRWLAHDDADFVVKTYAAVIGVAPAIGRTTNCAVLTPDQLAAWIAGLPPQRTLTAGRRERILEMVRDAAR
jgi:hypothetical protein